MFLYINKFFIKYKFAGFGDLSIFSYLIIKLIQFSFCAIF